MTHFASLHGVLKPLLGHNEGKWIFISPAHFWDRSATPRYCKMEIIPLSHRILKQREWKLFIEMKKQ